MLKQPRLVKKLYAQILEHEDYPLLSKGTRWAFECGIVAGNSWCERENRKWARKIWEHLYWKKWNEEML